MYALDLAARQLRLPQTFAPSSSSSGGGEEKEECYGYSVFRHSTRRSGGVSTTRLVAVRRGLRSLGASSDTIQWVSEARRKSTSSVYDSHWRYWVLWCRQNRVDPLSPTSTDLANHLSYLASKFKRSASALKVRRAAVSSTLAQFGHSVSGDLTIAKDVIKAASLKQARTPQRVPRWDLFLVLEFLRGPQFEPLSSASWANLTH